MAMLLVGGLWAHSGAEAAWIRWISLEQVARYYGMKVSRFGAKGLDLSDNARRVSVEADSRRLVYNGVGFYLNAPVTRRGNEWLISETDASRTLRALLGPDTVLAQASAGLIVLDPGHGGSDGGALGSRNLKEETVALAIAQRVRDRLKAAGYTVIMTRERSRTMSLDDRVALARARGADLYLSIHLNAAPNRTVSGFETYILPSPGFPATNDNTHKTPRRSDRFEFPGNRYDMANSVLGYYLQKGLLSYAQGEDRGVKRARFYVIRQVGCPAALVECGFVSNSGDARNLRQSAFCDDVADGLTAGIFTYMSRVKGGAPNLAASGTPPANAVASAP